MGAEGRNNLVTDPTFAEIGARTGYSVAHVVLRWRTQRKVIVIPKWVRPERMRENIDIFECELADDEVARIATRDTGASLFFDHDDPAHVSRLGTAGVD